MKGLGTAPPSVPQVPRLLNFLGAARANNGWADVSAFDNVQHMARHRLLSNNRLGNHNEGLCQERFPWVVKTMRTAHVIITRDPAPNDPDVHPIREPEPQPDTPGPEPGDEPERIDPVRTSERLERVFLHT